MKPELMKIQKSACAALAMLLLGNIYTHAVPIVVPGATGTDGPLTVAANRVIDLATEGTYDATQWAVVFRYAGVNIGTGATVTFKNHPSGAPVIWLVNGNVIIDGTVNLDGAIGATSPARTEPGPGGFAGGMGVFASIAASSGFGPGGGAPYYSGSYGTKATHSSARETYGNASLVPLVGGSGGGGDPSDTPGISGGAGGGAVLVAATGRITVNGSITAKGGNGRNTFYGPSGGGSGGGIRLVADEIAGTGLVLAPGGIYGGDTAGVGRIRFERVTMNINMNVSNQVAPLPSVLELASGGTAVIFPPAGSPTAKVLTVGGQAVTDPPSGSFGNVPADVKLAQSALGAGNTTVVVIETDNVSDASDVFLLAQPRAAFTGTMQYTAARDAAYVHATKDRWNVTVPVAVGYAALQVRVVRR